MRSALQIAMLATVAASAHSVEFAALPGPRSAGRPPAWNVDYGRGGIEPGKLDEWARRRRRAKGRKRR